jgi:hypothetical protein
MALTIPVDTARDISLEDYLEFVRGRLCLGDVDAVCDSAPMLARLANDRGFLARRLGEELRGWRAFQPDNAFTAQSFLLGAGDDFYLRANIWMPPEDLRLPRDRGNYLFSYQIPHDHNFSFLTVGYWGSGYETTIFEYDRDGIEGRPGEPVRLHFLERTALPRGKVMFYRALRDVHSQEPPEEFSISLNLILPLAEPAEQLFFDLDSSTVTGHGSAPGASIVALCRLAKYLGGSRAVAALEEIAVSHSCRRARSAAYGAWASLAPGFESAVWRRALDDPSRLIKDEARSRLG